MSKRFDSASRRYFQAETFALTKYPRIAQAQNFEQAVAPQRDPYHRAAAISALGL